EHRDEGRIVGEEGPDAFDHHLLGEPRGTFGGTEKDLGHPALGELAADRVLSEARSRREAHAAHSTVPSAAIPSFSGVRASRVQRTLENVPRAADAMLRARRSALPRPAPGRG